MGALDGITVGFIGLDGGGKEAATRIRSAGATTYAWNKSAAIRYEIARAGISLCHSETELADKAAGNIIILMHTPMDSLETLMDEDGAFLKNLAGDTIVIDAGDTGSEEAKRYAARVQSKGASWITPDADPSTAHNRALPVLEYLGGH